MSYRIGSFNCRHLGGTASLEKVSLIAQIISGEHFDVVALQELHGKLALEQLLSKLGKGTWDGKADDEVSDYGFIWNTKRLRRVETTVNGTKRTYDPKIYKQYRLDRSIGQKKFRRNPYYARFEPCHPGAPFIEIRLINTHIRFSKGQDSADDNSPGAVFMRQNEFDVLSQVIFPHIEDRVYGNNKTDSSYTVLLGDYNLNLKRIDTHSPYLPKEQVDIKDGKTIKKLITMQDRLTTLKNPKEKKDLEDSDPFSNNFDHCTYNQLRKRGTPFYAVQVDALGHRTHLTDKGVPHLEVSRVDVLKYLKSYETYLQNVSDHIPIAIDLILK